MKKKIPKLDLFSQHSLVQFTLSNLFLGAAVGAIEISCTYPTEYLKTVM